MSQPKKDRLPKKPSRFEKIQFWQSCWNFSKIVRNFAPKFHETNGSISGKRFSTAYKFPGKRIARKKLIKTDETQIWQSVEILLTKYDNIPLKFWKKS